MSEQNKLPEKDINLLLARSIGEKLEQGLTFSGMDDDLIDQLLAYKESELESYSHNLPNSANIWSGINQQTKPKAKIISLKTPKSYINWAAAAVVILAAFIGIFLYTTPDSTTLVARAEATKVSVTLEDGSEVTLRPYSALFKNIKDENRAYSLEGEAYFDVEHDPEHPFSVQAGEGTITVLGTRFIASNWGEISSVFLEEGSVQFSSAALDSVILEPGQSSEIQNGVLSKPEFTNEEMYSDWINNVIVFENNTPEYVIAELEQQFNISISIENLENRTSISGSLQLTSLEQTLDDLGLVLGGTFRKISETEYSYISME